MLHCRLEHENWVYESENQELSIDSEKWTKVLKENFDVKSNQEANSFMSNPENYDKLEPYTKSVEERETLEKISGKKHKPKKKKKKAPKTPKAPDIKLIDNSKDVEDNLEKIADKTKPDELPEHQSPDL